MRSNANPALFADSALLNYEGESPKTHLSQQPWGIGIYVFYLFRVHARDTVSGGGCLMGGFLQLCRPDECLPRVTDIDPARLVSQGFQGLLVDLDNTLLPWKSLEVPWDVKQWVEKTKSLGLKLCIVSNTHNPRRLKRIADELGVLWMAHALKPRRAGFVSSARRIGCLPEKVVVVGDQVLTDILGGNRAGMHTILVRPMHPREFVGTRINRVIERLLLRLLGLWAEA